ncbi:transposase-like protein [Paraburkholderia sp. WC7.3g]
MQKLVGDIGRKPMVMRASDDVQHQIDRGRAAAKRFFKRVLRSNPVPRKIVTDQLLSYPAANVDVPELVNVKHVFVKAAVRINNRTENRSYEASRSSTG